MATIWENTKKTNKTENAFTGTTLSSWSRQQKLAMIAGFGILGLILAISACSKQSAKPALVGVSSPAAPENSMTASAQPSGTPQTNAAAPAAEKAQAKKSKKRPTNVTYRDANSGLSFVFPRKYRLATGDKAQPQISTEGVPMDFVNGGGETIATVAMPKKLYAGTDFESGFFSVNVNHKLSAEECSRFAFVEMRRDEDSAVAPEKVKIGEAEMQMTDEFGGDAIKQAEARYYHNYENGACYEYVLGLGTAGYGLKDGIKPVNRDEIFSHLEMILASVKVTSAATEKVAKEQVPEQTAQPATGQPQVAQVPASEQPAVATAADANKTVDATKAAEPDKK